MGYQFCLLFLFVLSTVTIVLSIPQNNKQTSSRAWQYEDINNCKDREEQAKRKGMVQFKGSSNIISAGNYYYFSTNSNDKRNVYDARKICKQMGTDLVSIESREENNFILRQLFNKSRDAEHFWTGGSLSNKSDGRSWTWDATGKQFKFTDWERSQPSNSQRNDEHCMVIWTRMYKDRSFYGNWHDANCDIRYNFICEMELSVKCEDESNSSQNGSEINAFSIILIMSCIILNLGKLM